MIFFRFLTFFIFPGTFFYICTCLEVPEDNVAIYRRMGNIPRHIKSKLSHSVEQFSANAGQQTAVACSNT